MNAITPFTFPDTGQQVRSVVVDDEPWFVAADVCAVLAIGNSRSSVALLDDDEKGVHSIDTLGGDQQVSIVSESGLYSLILRSRKPDAKAFKRWVTHEVLPSIRRTGTYAVAATDELAALKIASEQLARAVQMIEAERAEKAAQQQRAEKAEGFVAAIEGGDGLTLRAFHKKYFSDVTEHQFMALLYARNLLINQLGTGSLREDGTRRDGAQHRHPSYTGKRFFYLHSAGMRNGVRRENTRVLPGRPELELRALLVGWDLPANEITTSMRPAITAAPTTTVPFGDADA